MPHGSKAIGSSLFLLALLLTWNSRAAEPVSFPRVNPARYQSTQASTACAADWFESESSASATVDATIPLQSGTYASWVAGVFANAPDAARGFAEDPDLDGLPNGLEYLLGADPLATNGTPLRASLDPAGFVVLEYERSREPVDIEALVVTRQEGEGTTWKPAATELISSSPVGSREWIRLRVAGKAGSIRYFRLGARLKP